MARPLQSAGSATPPPTVLLVEDDQDTAVMYATHLHGSGYWVATAQTAEEGCRTFDAIKPDIVVTDLGVPGRSDGLHVIEHVAHQESHRVPVILVTAHDRGSIPHAAAAHVATILVKPVLPDLLESEVRRTLERGRRARDRADQVLRSVPALLATSNRLAARATEIKHRARHAIGGGACPHCGQVLLRSTTRTEGKYEYFEPCPAGCGRFFRHLSTGRYYRLP